MENYYGIIGIAIERCLNLEQVGGLFGNQTGMMLTSEMLTAAESVLKSWTVKKFDGHLMILGLLQGLDNDVYCSLEVFQNTQDLRIKDSRRVAKSRIDKVLKVRKGRIELLDRKVVLVKDSEGSLLVGKDGFHLVSEGT